MAPEEPMPHAMQHSEDCPASSGDTDLEVSRKVQQSQQTIQQAGSQDPSPQNGGIGESDRHLTEPLSGSANGTQEEQNSVCSSALPRIINHSENTAVIKGEVDGSSDGKESPRSSRSSHQEQRVADKIKSNLSSVGRASIRAANSLVKTQSNVSKLVSSKTKGLRSVSTRSLAGLMSTTTAMSRGSDRQSRRNATMDLNFDDVVKAHKHMLKDQARLGAFCMLMPGSRVITLWTSCMIIVVLLAVCTAPVELGFQWWSTPLWWQVLVKVVDLFCINDMLLTFNVAFFSHGRLITSRRKVAFRYMRTWFVCDALSNTPWDWFLSGKSAKGRKLVKLLKLPKVFRVARLLRMVREQAHYVGTALILVGMLILAHYCSCLWAFVLIDCDPDDHRALKADNHGPACPRILQAYLEGLSVGMATLGGSDAWLRFHHALAVADGRGSVFSWTTPPGVTTELMSVGTCLVGVCALALLFGSISQAFRKVCENNRLFHDRLANLNAASGQHRIQNEIYMRARRHYHYIWNCGSDATRAILHDRALSVDLRRQLAFCFYGEYLKRVPFLASGEEGFLMQLCERVEVQYFSPMDALIRAGELGDELYFLAVGEVEVLLTSCSTPIKTLEEGSFFGELGLLFPEMKRTASIIATTSGCVLTVKREAFQEICSDTMLEIFRSIAKDRNNPEGGEDTTPRNSVSPAETQAGGGGGGGSRPSSPSPAVLKRGHSCGALQASGMSPGVRSDARSETLPGRMPEEAGFALPDAEDIFNRMCQQLEQTMLEWRQPFQRQINELNSKITLLEPLLDHSRRGSKKYSAGRPKWWSPVSSRSSRSSRDSGEVPILEGGRETRSASHEAPARSWSGRERRVQSLS
mmetsp:Transcript_10241/g.17886  ORF Transcript_10241/g.17886 Transcript_10241/m.17886 type:complete len:864 (-) Transcript_10241:146-2737(-)